MAAVIGVCVMIGAVTAVSERGRSHAGKEARGEVSMAGPVAWPIGVSASGGRVRSHTTSPRSETRRCPDHHRGLRYYRQRHAHWNSRRGIRVLAGTYRKPRSCPDARYLAVVWRKRAARAQQAYHRWVRNRYRAWLETPEGAIRHVFGPYAEQALRVAKCESGWSMTPRAHNGQYLGMFQMGSYARSTYGHGSTPLEQARAAYRYFVASGRDWSPWSCKP